MKRRTTTADAILTADWHLREDQPTCRTDDFQFIQWEKVRFVRELQQAHDCPVYHAGDLFNHWKPSPFLLSRSIKEIPEHFQSVYGNHDLPQHNINLFEKCGMWTMREAGKVLIMSECHWGETPRHISSYNKKPQPKGRKILVWHVMNYQGRKPWPGCTDPSSMKLLRKYPDYDLIVTGHNHKPFVETYEGRLLVNPGSLTRQSANETHRPRVYLWYAVDNSVEPVYLPAPEGVITREHIEIREQRDQRIEAFVSKLDDDWKAEMSFEDNLEVFFQTNPVRKSVKEIIYKSLDNE